MLSTAAITLLAIWLLGRVLDFAGIYQMHDLSHLLLLIGLMLLLIVMLKARDAAVRPPKGQAGD